ncbi:MAG: DUF4173 domain-containing protein [Verrucomicrobiales bacterium]|nr:DUF4173 domain-containing protein [Verrucomicrobiales bacterium]MCP5528275.1 DUF4173 domain-containing protein [Verrucomicrobiales bacterium]
MNESTKPVLRIVPISLGLGLGGDLLLRAPVQGVNLTLWLVALTLVLLVGIPRPTGPERPAAHPWLWAFGGFALLFSWRSADALRGLNVLTGFVLLAWAVARSRGITLRLGGVTDHFRRLAGWGVEVILGTFPMLLACLPQPGETATSRWRQWGRALVGVLLALPLLLVFGRLLTSADVAFEGWIRQLVQVDFPKVVSHVILTGFFGWIACGVLGSMLPEPAGRRRAFSVPRFVRLGPIETGVALGLVDLLFLAFVVFQVRYLFGGPELVETTVGLTYAEYARRGFFELVAVVALAVPVLLAADWLLAEGDRRWYRGLAGLMIGLLGVMLVSAAWRMRLYQQAYGWTELRFHVNAFMIWLAMVLAWFAATVLTGRRERFTFGAIAGAMVLVLSLNLVNPQARVAEQNLARAVAGEPLDVEYLGQLGPDAIPTMIRFLPMIPRAESASLRAMLDERSARSSDDWRGWTWARHAAENALRAMESR